MPKVNRYIAAFKESYNTASLATIVALSFGLLSPVPFLTGLILEIAYLLTVPDSKWYEARMARRFDADIIERRRQMKEAILPTLRLEIQARLGHLEETRRQIDDHSQEDKEWFLEVLRKLDYLMDKFLLFAQKEAQFRSYLERLHTEIVGDTFDLHLEGEERTSDLPRRKRRMENDITHRPLNVVALDTVHGAEDQWGQRTAKEIQERYALEQEKIEQVLAQETDEANRAVLIKRKDILGRRDEFAGKIGKILGNISHQLRLVEDTFGLINDEIRARSPEQILADIEEVVIATDSMSSALEELAPYERMVSRIET
ncbi:hypothetical protein LBMAG21_14830 [Armatimonadota bacterium]|nr:hypothetical protein LBMAG21_14830 [Armatimonadota bacterium]